VRLRLTGAVAKVKTGDSIGITNWAGRRGLVIFTIFILDLLSILWNSTDLNLNQNSEHSSDPHHGNG